MDIVVPFVGFKKTDMCSQNDGQLVVWRWTSGRMAVDKRSYGDGQPVVEL
jgi:hypothetical protein